MPWSSRLQFTGGGTGHVLSGQIKGATFYRKTLLRRDVLTTFIWQYPAAGRARMEAVIQYTIATGRPGG